MTGPATTLRAIAKVPALQNAVNPKADVQPSHAAGDIQQQPRSRLITLSHNPRFQVIWPVSPQRFHNIATNTKPVPTTGRRNLPLITKTFWQTRQTAETGEINRSETPHAIRCNFHLLDYYRFFTYSNFGSGTPLGACKVRISTLEIA